MGSLRLPQYRIDDPVDPLRVIRWAADRFSGRIAMSSSFQTQSVPLLHMLGHTAPQIPVLFLDTGYHFPETLTFRDQLVERLGLNLQVLRGAGDARVALLGGSSPPYETDPDRCCWVNKVEPMKRAMQKYDAWISGIRADQTGARARMGLFEETEGGILRIHPLIEWTAEDVTGYIVRHELPRHPLAASGYTSIGCAPCTRRPDPGEDERMGRWSGLEKTECGLHTDLASCDEGRSERDAAEGRSQVDEPAVPPKE